MRIANALSSIHIAGPSSAQFGAWSAQTKGVVEGSGVVVVEVVVIVVVDGALVKNEKSNIHVNFVYINRILNFSEGYINVILYLLTKKMVFSQILNFEDDGIYRLSIF